MCRPSRSLPSFASSLLSWISLAVLLVACDLDEPDFEDDGPLESTARSAISTEASPVAAVTPSAVRPSIGDGAYPAPPAPPAATPGLHDIVANLPDDVVLDTASAMACPRTAGAPQGRALALVPASTNLGMDLVAVASDAERSVAGWRLSENLAPIVAAGELTDIRQRNAWVIDADSGAAPPSVVVQATDSGGPLWVIECGYAPRADLSAEAAGPSVIAVLSVDPISTVDKSARLEIRLADWSGDGKQEALAGDFRQRLLFADLGAGWLDPLTPLDGGAAVVDLDRDGRLEAVELQPEGDWRLQTWTGEQFEVRNAQNLAPAISVVDPEALPSLPTDLVLRRLEPDETAVWRWPAAGGTVERIEGAETSTVGKWQALFGAGRRDSARSTDDWVAVTHRVDDLESPAMVAADPEDLATGATRSGAIHVIDPSGKVADQPLVATYDRQHEEMGGRSFMGLSLSANGEQLAWSDGVGLWMIVLPDGRPELLAALSMGFPSETDSVEGIHLPAGWSPDGRFLLVQVSYYEGGGYGLWDMEDGSYARIPDSFGYVDGYSDIAWLRSGQLLHARSGGDFGGNASLSLLDPTDLNQRDYIYQAWPRLHEMASATILGFGEHLDGSIFFGLRSNLPFDAASNGIFVLPPGGEEPERIAGIPTQPPNEDDPFIGGGFRCQLIFAPDASTFVCSGREAGSGDQRTFVGRTDTGELWDASPVFGSEGVGPIDAIAFAAEETSN